MADACKIIDPSRALKLPPARIETEEDLQLYMADLVAKYGGSR